MKPLLVLYLLLPAPLFAQTPATPLELNPMTELLTSLTPPPEPPALTITDADVNTYLAAKETSTLSPGEQRLADLEAEWQQRKAVMEAELEVLRTAAAYAEAAVKAAESAAIANQYAPRPLYPTYPVYPKSSYLCVSRPVMRNTTYVWCQ